MDGPCPVHLPFVLELGLDGLELVREKGLCPDEVNVGQELIRVEDIRRYRADLIGELGQDPYDFPSLVALQFTDTVVGLDDHLRFDKDGFSAGGLVVDNTLDLPLERRGDGDHQPAVAHGRGDILLDKPLCLRGAQDGLQAS